jgi:hypothetical protein
MAARRRRICCAGGGRTRAARRCAGGVGPWRAGASVHDAAEVAVTAGSTDSKAGDVRGPMAGGSAGFSTRTPARVRAFAGVGKRGAQLGTRCEPVADTSRTIGAPDDS